MKTILDSIPIEIHESFLKHAEVYNIPAKTQLVSEGDQISKIPFVIKGRIRVFKEDSNTGKELLLYHVRNGQTCFMSIVASIRKTRSKVDATTCIASKVVFIPITQIEKWSLDHPEWTVFVLDAFMDRYCELVDSLESMTFDTVEIRIEKFLKKQSILNKSNKIRMTHQKLANSIGSTRVVISRLLKKLELEGKVSLLNREIVVHESAP